MENAANPGGLNEAIGGFVKGLFESEQEALAAYFALKQGGADYSDLARGLRDGTGELLAPIGSFASDLGLLMSVVDPNTRQPNQFLQTPEGQALLQGANDRMASRFETVGTAIGGAASASGQLASDLRPPLWAFIPGYLPTAEEVSAYETRVSRGADTIANGLSGAAKGVLMPFAEVVDACIGGAGTGY